MTKQYAVIMAEGWFRDVTEVMSVHTTAKLALRAAATHRVSIPGNKPNQQIAMVIRSTDGFRLGQRIYGDTLHTRYEDRDGEYRPLYEIVTAKVAASL